MPESPTLVQRVLRHQLLWPVLALVVLLLVNVAVKPTFTTGSPSPRSRACTTTPPLGAETPFAAMSSVAASS